MSSEKLRTEGARRGGISLVKIGSWVLQGVVCRSVLSKVKKSCQEIVYISRKGGINWLGRHINKDWATWDAGEEGLPSNRKNVFICGRVH